MEPVGSTLTPVQVVHLRLNEAETNVAIVAQKLQENLDSDETLVIVDSKGQEIHDSPGTQGLLIVIHLGDIRSEQTLESST